MSRESSHLPVVPAAVPARAPGARMLGNRGTRKQLDRNRRCRHVMVARWGGGEFRSSEGKACLTIVPCKLRGCDRDRGENGSALLAYWALHNMVTVNFLLSFRAESRNLLFRSHQQTAGSSTSLGMTGTGWAESAF